MALYNYDTPTNSIGDENYEIVDTADDLRRPVVEVKRLSVPNYFQPRQQHLVSRKDRVSMLNPLYGFSFGKR